MVKAVTKYGAVKGKKKEGFITFRGIPYAKPPVGDLRFRPPREPDSWEGVRDCTKFGAPALQLFAVSHVLQPNILEISSEDCLYLNVSTPAVKEDGKTGDLSPDEQAKLPVYVFLHGGAFETGGGNMLLYRGENFANKGIVYVNINYRMSIFGFMALEEFRRESSVTGCFGVQDALQALRWVKENIAAFGGDPDNVTLGGESAGASTTSILLGLREAKVFSEDAFWKAEASWVSIPSPVSEPAIPNIIWKILARWRQIWELPILRKERRCCGAFRRKIF